MDIKHLLELSVQKNASDLHLSAGLPPMIRVDGDIQQLWSEIESYKNIGDGNNAIFDNTVTLTSENIDKLMVSMMSKQQRKDYEQHLECDFSYEIADVGRFRINAFHQHRGAAAVLRIIPHQIVTLEDLEAPKILKDITRYSSGLVLVTGSTGSGKSTTLAAMIDNINTTSALHIITLEDPIEFIHTSKKSIVHQREVHTHTLGFAPALRSALREDPDVILVGELRDLETIRLALTAAETGHLVLATLHTGSAPKTIDRIIDVFPGAEKDMVRSMLSESLRAVITQKLVKKNGGGRVAAHEIMLATPAIRHLIRENKVAQMMSVMQTGQAQGMRTFEQSLQQLMVTNHIMNEEIPRSLGMSAAETVIPSVARDLMNVGEK